MQEEIKEPLGQSDRLSVPKRFRDLVAQARLGVSVQEHEAFFRGMLGDVEEPTAPFGLLDVRGDGTGIEEARITVESALARRIRERAGELGVSAASLWHVAWAQVLARVSGREDVVFGTVLFGRMQGGAGIDRIMGPFINTLPVRIRVGEEGVEAGVRGTHMLLAELLRHEHASLALAQGCSAVAAPTPLFSGLLNYQHRRGGARSEEAVRAWEGIKWLRGEERTNYPFTLAVDDLGKGFRLTAQTLASINPMRVCEFMCTAMESLVKALETAPAIALRTLEVLPAKEREQVLREWNDTEAEYPRDKCVHELFEEQVSKTPGAVAVVYEDQQLTYQELNERANRLGHYLRELGVGPDSRVGICVDRGLEMIVAVLGVLKAGGAYVPLDPEYPVERLRYMLEDSGPTVLLTQGHLQERFGGAHGTLSILDITDAAAWSHQPETNPERAANGLRPEHLAYVIYTSGSTGRPKGVMVEHANVLNLWSGLERGVYQKRFDCERVSLNASLAFDASVQQLIQVLSGRTLVIIPREIKFDVEALLKFMAYHRIDALDCTPSQLSSLLAAGLLRGEGYRLKVVLVGGEAIDLTTWQILAQSLDVTFYNVYGPTECAVDSTMAEVKDYYHTPHIGRPIANTQIYILDRYGEPVPAGVVGELYIGGAGVARGYLNQPELTAERFLRDPFAVAAGREGRMYRTGDLGRWLKDGTIEFLGRNDEQVKIRGFRVELGEIEARLAEHEGVREAVVVAREDVPGEKRLVAYYTVAETNGQGGIGAEMLRAHLSARLPEYMVPAGYVRLERMPLTVNGKLDRKGLPAPDGDAYGVRGYEAPQGETETVLAAIWAELLHVERVGRHDNFFELGGHSLLAVALMERMQRQGLHADIGALFTTPTLAELAVVASGDAHFVEVPENRIPAGCQAITPEMLPLVELSQAEIEAIVRGVPGGAGNVQDIYPLAPLQEGILFHHLMGGEGDPYLSGNLFSFDTRARLDGYLKAMQAVINRHDILRTGVVWEGIREPVQVVWREAALAVEEVALDSDEDAGKQLYERYDPRRYRIDVREAPLLRAYITYDRREGRWLLMLLLYHLAGDHITLEVMQEEMKEHLLGQSDRLSVPKRFRDLVAQARLGVSVQEHEAFFRGMLGDVEEPTAPFGLLDVRGDGTGIEEARITVESALARRIRERAGELGVSAASLWHVAWAQVLARVSGREDVVFGTVLFGRMQGGAGIDRMMGPLINTLPVRIRVGEEGVEAGVRGTHMLLAELLRHEHASLALAQRCSAVAAPTPLFSGLLNYRHSGGGARSEEAVRAWEGIKWLRGEERTNYPFTLSVDDLGKGFRLTAQTLASINPMRVCEFMCTAMESLVKALETAPAIALRTLEVLPAKEREQVLREWNDTEAEYPRDKCVHELFEEQVSKTPGAVAVVYEDQQLTYQELNERANRLGHYLRELGVGPDSRVGICVDRGLEMIVAVLGVLKAGGAYVPLDPEYPVERLRYMLEDSGPTVLLTQGHLQERFGGAHGTLSILDITDAAAWSHQPETNPERAANGLRPEHLAYVIYTSGSTGRPKGVLIEHRSLMNYLWWANQNYCNGERLTWPLFSSLAFDLTVTSLFTPLISGGSIVIYRENTGARGIGIIKVVEGDMVDIVKLTPSHLAIIQDMDLGATRIRKIIVGGEDFKTELARKITGKFGRSVDIYNEYGPTEATVGCMIHRYDEDKDCGLSVPIGFPAANTNVYILDKNLNPVPRGLAGEIYLAGDGLARGYLNRPDLTEQRFLNVQDPRQNCIVPLTSPFESHLLRLYKTGDVARWISHGRMEFLGRVDHQVKVGGARIEMGDIEAQLLAHPEIRECVVDVVPLSAMKQTPKKLSYCARCGVASNLPGITYDANGLCNLCRAYEGYKDRAQAYFKSMDDFTSLAAEMKANRSGAYDCVVLFSGGKDSAFMLYKICEMGLKPLAFTLDNGFLSHEAKSNILRVVQSVGIDHVFGSTPHMNDIFVDSLKQFANVCNGCFKTIYTLATNLAHEKGIRYIVTGLSRGQFFETRLTEEAFNRQDINLVKLDALVLEARKAYHQRKDAVACYLPVDILQGDGIFDEIQFVDFYRYWSVPLEEMYMLLKQRGAWSRPSDTGRSTNCLINDLGIYVHKKQRGFHNYSLPYSWDVRLGQKTRSEAMEELEDQIDEARVKEIMAQIGYAEPQPDEESDLGQLVAYYVSERPLAVSAVRAHLAKELPEYMVPAYIVWLEKLPIAPNGKINRKALPVPEANAYGVRGYEAPQGETETVLAAIWAELLHVERVGRHDNFFQLGGHSLLAVLLKERMQRQGLHVDMRGLFMTPTLAELAVVASGDAHFVEVPENRIPAGCQAITPEMLPLVELSQAEIEAIVRGVPGGAGNVQDIYPLAPLQEGILFHHLMGGEGDPYLLCNLFSFDTRARLDGYLKAMQAVINRHDILRTGVVWEGIREPVQVVWREAALAVEEVALDSDEDAGKQLYERYDPRRYRIDVREAPLLRAYITYDRREGRWLLMLLLHHLAGDHITLEVMQEEMKEHLLGQSDRLSVPKRFRDLVAQARLGVSVQEHEAFFRGMLGDVEEPTAPFGLLDVRGDGTGIEEARITVESALARRIRERAGELGVSAASLWHVAWAQVLARVSGREDVVFGTVLFGRMQGGAGIDRMMGPFINTLPVRIRVGEEGVEAGVRGTHMLLAELLRHEHASLALAQGCSAVAAPTPLFSGLLNYRHSGGGARSEEAVRAWEGIKWLRGEERTNYPFTLAVDDLGKGFRLTAQTLASINPMRVCEFMCTAMESLVKALETAPAIALRTLEVLPAKEREQVLREWNDTEAEYPRDKCVHELFEEQVSKTPGAVAVVYEDQQLTYQELNERANRLGHYLRELGVGPDSRVGICVDRGLEMIVAVLGVLKAGGAYVPLDPEYPVERLRYMLEDSGPTVLLTQGHLQERFGGAHGTLSILDITDAAAWSHQPETNPERAANGLRPEHLAYVIYTSGSTGRPKGVMVEHRGVVNRLIWMQRAYGLTLHDAVLQKTPISFDVSVWECLWPLFVGARLVMARPEGHKDPAYLVEAIRHGHITTMHFVPSMLQVFLDHGGVAKCSGLRQVICSGEVLPGKVVRCFQEQLSSCALHNLYGPTEAAIDVTAWTCPPDIEQVSIPIGRPIANTQIYILDRYGEPVPAGVVGELYIGGVQVARGYLNQPELTAERFLRDPFAVAAGREGRMYRTGDLGRWLKDGTIEFLGRNDEQVKIRGFRVELGEIEARLAEHEGVREAVVVAREDVPGEKRLVAYYTVAETNGQGGIGAEMLRAHLSARLPEYMVPAGYVRLERMPLTVNGKLDRKGLPAPDGDAYGVRGYEAPQGETETVLAAIWAELLHVERVGRHDNFFELGGHSLLAVALKERMQRQGLHVDMRGLFMTPTLAELAVVASGDAHFVEVPENRIPAGCQAITPEMLPLVELSQAEIEAIVRGVPGGAGNVQDIYPLAPLQEGILFHHLMGGEGDPYLLCNLFSFDTRARLDGYLKAMQAVINRHDILRTGVVWEGIREPVQVVWREAALAVEEVALDSDEDAGKQLYERYDPRRYRIDVREAPLLRAYITYDRREGRWLLMLLLHHLTSDHITLEVMQEEMKEHLLGQSDRLSVPKRFRDLVAQARLGVSVQEHEAFFRGMLGDVEEPTAPFGLLDVRGDGTGIEEARITVESALARRIRERAGELGVSAASLWHVAWAQVLARVSGREDVVFGTVLFGRMQGGAGIDRMMGPFINTLPVRIRVGEEGVEAGVRGTHMLLAELLRHEHASLALAQGCSAVAAPTPLFSGLLNYRHSGGGARSEEAVRAWEGIKWLRGEERTNYPFTLSVDDLGKGFRLTAQTLASINPMRVCEFMCTAMESLVKALETAPAIALRTLEVLPAKEREQVLREWNDTEAEYPRDKCVHELFEEQVSKTPGAVAVVYEDQQLTYQELNERANRLGHYLRELGVGPDSRVGICVDRGLEMIVAVLGVLKAGGAYVPLDPEYPVERLRYMLEDSGPTVLLTQGHLQERFGGAHGTLSILDITDAAAWSHQPETNPERAANGLRPEHLAYVIYTSGSTGRPKGVMVEHRGVVNRLIWMQRAYGLTLHDAVLQKTPISFDVSVWECLWPLFVGARLVMARPEGHKDPAYLVEAIRHGHITTMHFVPSMLQVFLDHGGVAKCSGLRQVICSGEVLPGKVVRCFQEQLSSCALHNLYGPTEAAIDVTAWTCPPDIEQVSIPIGRPIANTQIYILDRYGEPVPAGVVGELYIGGVQVARGYLNQPELTAERFLRDPFAVAAGREGRMYRTGDLGRWLKDGTIEFLGRNDEQVKIRGFRVELGEIEARLAEHEGVREAVVVAREDVPGEKRLVAYYTVAETNGQGGIGAEMLRAHLSARLPEYMVPAGYVRLERMPLTVNGKLDRKGLPAPDGDAYGVRGYEAPQGETETVLAAIWAELLHVERVGRHDNFFELGGHSLLVVQAISRVRQALGVNVSLGDLFARPVLSGFAGHIETATHEDLPAIVRVDRSGELPLSFAQQRLWFLSQMKGGGEAYHISFGVHLSGKLNSGVLRRALDRIVERHETLRTSFVATEGEAAQRIASIEDSRFHLIEHDLRDHENAEEELNRLGAKEARTPFNFERGPLIRGRLIQMEEDEHALLITMHHIISDGWSMGVLLNELSVLYGAFLRGEDDPLPELDVHYVDYVVWQRQWIEGDVLREQADYWKTILTGVPALLQLPTDHPRPAQQDYAGAFIGLELDAKLTAGLKELSRRHGTTMFMTLLAGWAALLARLSGQQDVVVGTPVANRRRIEVEGLIGLFVNTLALRLDLAGSPTVGELIARVRAQALTAQQQQDIPFEQVVEIARPVRSLAQSPLFQVAFTWQNASESMLVLPGLEAKPLRSSTYPMAKFDLTLSLKEEGENVVGGFVYATSLFESATIERYKGYFRALLEGMVADDTQEMDRLPILPAKEREQVLREWNDTEAEYPRDKCVHELFEEQVSKTPGAVAVVYEDQQLTYQELNERANRLGHYLRELGVGPDSRVGICVDRGLEMIVAVLGVLKAGGAYVPLDPEYPVERLRYMLEDSGPTVLLTQGHLQERFGGAHGTLSILDITDAAAWSHQPETNPERAANGLRPEHLAYVIYTSGSTGRPKGVMVEHANVLNLWSGLERGVYQKRFDCERVSLNASLAFDASVQQLIQVLSGRTLVIIPREIKFDVEALLKFMAYHRIDALDCTPSQLSSLLAAGLLRGEGYRLKVVLVGGEAIDLTTWQILAQSLDVTFYNVYGPTECAVDSTMAEVKDYYHTPHIGRPIANTQIYILDRYGEPVPAGVVGELYIGGAGVARGYLNQPELTAERFLRDPFAVAAGREGRMYRTGDLGRWLKDGTIEFLGRNDEQVKIRGFRVELGEIEARLAEHEGVREAVVVAREDVPGEKRLVAYYTVAETNGQGGIGAEMLRAHLSARLPEYMVPAGYVRLERMPLTVNGKLDRKGLPAPDGDAYGVRGYEAPQGETETVLAAIWAELLHVERVGRHDNFFELGGHSLLAAKVVLRIQRSLGVRIAIGRIFTFARLYSLADHLIDAQLAQFDQEELADVLRIVSNA